SALFASRKLECSQAGLEHRSLFEMVAVADAYAEAVGRVAPDTSKLDGSGRLTSRVRERSRPYPIAANLPAKRRTNRVSQWSESLDAPCLRDAGSQITRTTSARSAIWNIPSGRQQQPAGNCHSNASEGRHRR